MPLLAPSPQGARDGLSPVTGTMRSCRACCWWLSKTQNWTHTHPAQLKSPRLEQGHGSQTCFWHREELTQACNPQELLTQMCPWTGKGLLTPCQLPPKYSPSPSPPLAYVPCPEQLMSHWCPSFKTGVCRASRMPTLCSSASPASPKGWCNSTLGVSDAQPFNSHLHRGKNVL